MSLADLLRSLPPFGDFAAEHARQMTAVDVRAERLHLQRSLGHIEAREIAKFSLGTWARRYPVQGYDLGEDAALFIVDWLATRAMPPSEEAMHEAFAEWQVRRTHEDLARAVEKNGARGKVDVAKMVEALAGVAEVEPIRDRKTRPANRLERRRAASRRWKR